MKKRRRILSAALGAAVAMSAFTGFAGATASAAEAKTPQYQTTAREMEKLNRGLIAVKTTKDTREQTVDGVVLSWRLLGDESLENQAFDIYRDETKIHTTGIHDATYYIDTAGKETNTYKVVKAGATATEVAAEEAVTPATTFSYAKPSEVGNGNSLKHSFTYVDIPISMPTDIKHANTTALSDYKRNSSGAGGANDASVGDLDGDGDYEIVLKWDPVDSRDAAGTTTTGDCVLDAYEIDPNNTGYKWRIDLGQNITAGAHSTQFMVYDFDGDGKAEIACQTAEGSYSIDSTGEKHFVTEVGDSEEIRNGDNNATHLSRGKNIGADYLTIFDGETGRPLKTTAGIPLGSANGSDWGDSKLNRSSRYLAAVAYLDGIHPSFIAIRGMYNRTIIRAYNWDGEDLSLLWEHNGNKKGTTMYGEGNHNLNIADIDNDGKDEIVYGSACLDDDGKTVLGNTQLGHGDAMHTSDFNNDGVQEVFSVKEDSEGFKRGTDFRVAKTGTPIWSKKVSDDNGRGLMGNIDDAYASTHPNALSLGWAAAHAEAFDLSGTAVGAKPSSAGKGDFCNFLVYWDGDLSSELLDANIIQKYDAANGWTKRFYGPSDGYTLSGTTNNDSKRNYSLVADIWGDWREEIIMPVNDSSADAPALRIFTSIVPTEYRLTTLMHDSQYRTAIAWQNVGYNQPPHTSYYIGSAALATDASGNKLNYLAPATAYTKVKYASSTIDVPVTGITLSQSKLSLEKGETATIQAVIEPETADKKTVTWTTSDANVATVSNGVVTAKGDGTATITATTKDTTNGTLSATCEVEVHSTPVTGLNFPGYDNITIMQGGTANIDANVVPSNATDKIIHWSSTNENVATVDSDGVVTGVGSGSAIIRAITDEGGHMGEKIVSVAGKVEDLTGENNFTGTYTDSQTTFSADANSASFKHTEEPGPVEFHKDFEPCADSKTTLHFNFVTGGDKVDGKYIWLTGHEYNTYIEFLDTEGNNILTVKEAHTNSSSTGVSTQFKVGDGEYGSMSGWKQIADGSDSPFNRSQIRWDVTVDFNNEADSATVTWAGCDSSYTPNVTYQYTFPLDGAVFKTLKYEVDGITDWIKGNPGLSSLSYTKSIPSDGVGSKIYDKATLDSNKWTDADIVGWTVTGGQTLKLDSTNNRIYFHPKKPATSYSAEKKFDISDGALVTYDFDWYFQNQVGADKEHTEYAKIGSKIMFGWKSDYKVHVSKDGGETWEETTLFTGANNVPYVKNVQLVYDKKTKTIKSLLFDSTPVSGFAGLPLDDAMDSVSFGLTRITDSATEDWEYPNGIDNLTVLQFIEGADQSSTPVPDITPEPSPSANPDQPTTGPVTGAELEITDFADNTVSYHYSGEFSGTATIIAALYGSDNVLKDVKLTTIPENGGTLTFSKTAEAGDIIKLFAWDMSKVSPINGLAADSDTVQAANPASLTSADDEADEAVQDVAPGDSIVVPDNVDDAEDTVIDEDIPGEETTAPAAE